VFCGKLELVKPNIPPLSAVFGFGCFCASSSTFPSVMIYSSCRSTFLTGAIENANANAAPPREKEPQQLGWKERAERPPSPPIALAAQWD